jgi:hypothetical protein
MSAFVVGPDHIDAILTYAQAARRDYGNAAEAAHDQSCNAMRSAERALRRSKSNGNRAAYIAASEAFEATLAACIAEREAAEKAYNRAERAARFSAVNAEPAQLSLF